MSITHNNTSAVDNPNFFVNKLDTKKAVVKEIYTTTTNLNRMLREAAELGLIIRFNDNSIGRALNSQPPNLEIDIFEKITY